MSLEAHHQDGNLARQLTSADEINMIYQNQSDSFSDGGTWSERVVDMESFKLFKLADKITAARQHRIENQFLTHDEQQKKFAGNVAKVLFDRAIPIRRSSPITHADLKSEESLLGANIFGEMQPGEVRHFWYDQRIGDRDSWFFHQVINDDEVTLHYEVHPTGILRISSKPDAKNEFISGQEQIDFSKAAKVYHELVMENMYSQYNQSSGKKAA